MIPMIVMTDRNAGRTAPSCRPAEREGLMTQEKAGCGKSARPVWASLRRVEWIPTDTAKYWLARPSQLDHGFGNFARLLGTQLIAAVLTLGAFISKQGLLQYSAAQFAAVANFRGHDGKITNLLAAWHNARNRTQRKRARGHLLVWAACPAGLGAVALPVRFTERVPRWPVCTS